MELPPYRMPTMKSIFRHTWEKGAQYLKKMGGIIMIASIIIWFLGYYPDHDAYPTQAEQQENSYIGQIGQGSGACAQTVGLRLEAEYRFALRCRCQRIGGKVHLAYSIQMMPMPM